MNCKVYIGAGERYNALFRNELAGLNFIDFPGFSPSYSGYFPQYIIMLLKTPVLLYHIIKEHYELREIIRRFGIDIVISDNRFGLWNKSICSVYVTHMPRIPLPHFFKLLEFTGILLHRLIIRKYNYCMIPDLPGSINLSGRLSHDLKLPENVRYCGILSRFDTGVNNQGIFGSHHNTIILSGPEPQKSILKHKLENVLRNKESITIILEGEPEKTNNKRTEGNLIYYSHLPAEKMAELIRTSESVISRSGYTTIMDLIYLNCSGLLIPTPGQTEQEYLADYLSEKGWFGTIKQDDINENLPKADNKPSWDEGIIKESSILQENFLNELLKKYKAE